MEKCVEKKNYDEIPLMTEIFYGFFFFSNYFSFSLFRYPPGSFDKMTPQE